MTLIVLSAVCQTNGSTIELYLFGVCASALVISNLSYFIVTREIGDLIYRSETNNAINNINSV
jgi:hypothetical protein